MRVKHDILDIIEILRMSDRIGHHEDDPEGSRYIQLSDTLVCEIVESLEVMNATVDWSPSV